MSPLGWFLLFDDNHNDGPGLFGILVFLFILGCTPLGNILGKILVVAIVIGVLLLIISVINRIGRK